MTKNIDNSEIKKFNALASRWWDPNSEFKPLHDINPLRVNFIEQHSPVAEKKVLDVGCGGGILCEALAHRGANVTGIDMADASINVAQLHLLENNLNIDYQQITAEELSDTHAKSFDIVTCLEMLEHVPDPASTIKACAKLAKPGAALYFSTINRNPKAFIGAILGAEYILKLLPKGTHSYGKFIKPAELMRFIRESQLQEKAITGLNYNPLTKQYRLSNDVSINYITYVVKPNST